ncbi:MAG: Ig-like domain-containing protein, partial [Lachnospiraceae bacterium]|nr:Ig-like domain-containing protein [Lachnospiraceae bacterium]
MKNTKKKVTWKSSNKKVAKVSKKGKVTALKKGTAKITAKVSGKKFTCNVNVVKKKKSTTQAAKTDNNATDTSVSTTQSNNAQTTTEQAQVATTTESSNAQTTTEQTQATTTTQAQESTTTQEDSLDVKELNLSDIHFDSDGYSTENFFIDFSMMVTASGMNYKEYYYSEEEFDDVTLSFVNSKGDIREFNCGIYPGAEENEFTLKDSPRRDSLGKPVKGLRIPIGNYDVLYDGLYCASITPNDFKNLLNYESSSTYDADVQIPEVNIVIGSGTVTNSSNVANSDIDILIQQFVREKEYTSYASLGNDGTYTKCFIDGYNYDVLPCGLGDGKITANVSDGQIQGSLDIAVSADYQKVIFNDSKNEFNLEQHNLSLKSDTNEIRICDENNNYYAIVLADTYDLYYDEYKIQEDIVITKETTEIDLIMPRFTVTLSMNGVSVTDLSDYKVANEKTKEEIAIPSEATAFEVTPGTYTLSYMSNVVGKYTVSLDSAADDGTIVWEIPCVKVSLKNFDTSLNIGDYVVKDENETEIEMEEGAVEVTLPAGDYDVNEKNGEELGDHLGQYSVTWEQASQGSNVVWDLELASVTGKITGI